MQYYFYDSLCRANTEKEMFIVLDEAKSGIGVSGLASGSFFFNRLLDCKYNVGLAIEKAKKLGYSEVVEKGIQYRQELVNALKKELK